MPRWSRSRDSCARCSRAPSTASVREKIDGHLTSGAKTLEGEVLNQGFDDLQLRTADSAYTCCAAWATRFAR